MSTWRGNPWVVLLTLSLGFSMTLLDLTAVNVAIPSMVDTLHASLNEVLWVINVYVLALAALLITSGRLGDAYGAAMRSVSGERSRAWPSSPGPRSVACWSTRQAGAGSSL